MTHKFILIGFGTVGQGLAKILKDKRAFLKNKYDFEYEIVAVATKTRGSVVDEKGIDCDKLISLLDQQKSLNDFGNGVVGLSVNEIIEKTNADMLIEISHTNIETGQPATDYCRAALERGMSVVTANKGPIVLHYPQLKKLADANKVFLGIEGTVMAGTPVLNTGMWSLAGCKISGIRGILNSTTNFMLSEMESGKSYSAALEEAQKLGFAEADPTADVDGWDAVAKVVILSNVLMDGNLSPADVKRKGITGITKADIEQAKAENKRWKLIGEVRKKNGELSASVQSALLPISDPLARISGRLNGITFKTDLLGPVTVMGSGGGGQSTGFALLSDMLAIHRNFSYKQAI